MDIIDWGFAKIKYEPNEMQFLLPINRLLILLTKKGKNNYKTIDPEQRFIFKVDKMAPQHNTE